MILPRGTTGSKVLCAWSDGETRGQENSRHACSWNWRTRRATPFPGYPGLGALSTSLLLADVARGFSGPEISVILRPMFLLA